MSSLASNLRWMFLLCLAVVGLGMSREHPVYLPRSLKCKVLVVDPKWHFVVLNVGEDQGVLESGELLINRHGRLIAKVRVVSVKKERCVADLMPGWQLGDVLEGDSAIPAHPSSS